MWSFASNAIAGTIGLKNDLPKPSRSNPDCSDEDEVSSNGSRDEGLECPICFESFNIVENVPYVLWCGHTLCKNCVLGLQWAIVKFPSLPFQLPLFISCPWCHLLSFRLVYKGNLKFPRKNFFLLWMVESMNGDRVKSHSHSHSAYGGDNLAVLALSARHRDREHTEQEGPPAVGNANSIPVSLRKSLAFFVRITSKFPLIFIFLLIILYVIPASAVILVLYILITVLFALPSALILCFAYPSLDWLVREIVT